MVNVEGRVVCRYCINNEDEDMQRIMRSTVDEVLEERERNRGGRPSREQLAEVIQIFQQATGLSERCFRRCDATRRNWQRCARVCIQENAHWGGCLCIRHFSGNPFTRPNEEVTSASVKMLRPAEEIGEGLTPEEKEEFERLLQQRAARDARIRELEEERRELEKQLREEGVVESDEEEVREDENLCIEEAVEKRLNRWGYSWTDPDQHEFVKRFEEECAVEVELRTLKQEVKEKAKTLRKIYQDRKTKEEENQRDYRLRTFQLQIKKQNDEVRAHMEEQ